MTALLHVDGVVAGYGAGDILRGVDLSVAPGTVTCLIGPNGAGKSTLLKTISGLLRPSRGHIIYRDEAIETLRPKARLRAGIVHVPQDRSLFPLMSVRDNLLMGAYLIKNPKVVAARMDEAMAAFPICRERARDRAGSLSGGEQKQVEFARTLILDPTLILLDEPSIGLDPKARHLVFTSIQTLAATGRTILLVEQNARSGLSVSTTGVVLEAGVVRLSAGAEDLLTDPRVAQLYLGATASVPKKETVHE